MNGIINACSVITRGKNIVIHFILVLQFITFDREYIYIYAIIRTRVVFLLINLKIILEFELLNFSY